MDGISVTDKIIWQILAEDQEKGIRLLFERYYVSLVLYAGNFLHDQQQAEDVVQEFFVRLWEDGRLYRITASSIVPYLFTSVRNSCLTCLKKKDMLKEAEDFRQLQIPVEAFVDLEDDRISKVMGEIALLPERTRLVVESVMLRGKKYKEVALELKISVNTVKFLLKEGVR